MIFSLIFWSFIFSFSLFLLIKGSDWFVENAERIGLALKISPFIVGVTIVALGTSFPELFSSVAAVLKNTTEIVGANIIGSNIFNILVIIGLSAVVAGKLIVTRSLIDLDAPLLALSTVILLFVCLDKEINLGEGIVLLLAYLIYFLYTIYQRKGEKEEETPEIVEVLPSRVGRREKEAGIIEKEVAEKVRLDVKTFVLLFLGIAFVLIGADWTINSLIKLSEILKVSPALISIIALSAGTSLPEVVVSTMAAAKKKYEISLGNIFGSNVFNGSFIPGVSALIKPLIIDNLTFSVGLPFLIASTLIFVVSCISRRIHIWEGSMYLLIYLLFLVKIFNLF
jgi:cation:H+ antiporter